MNHRDKGIVDDARYRVPNLERALAIMECLVDHPEGLGISELTDQLGFPKNSVFRITATLLRKGYLVRDDDTKRFALTRKLLAMGCEALTEEHILAVSLDVMKECRDEIRETVLFGTLVEDEGVVMEQVLGSHPFKFSVDLGMRLHIHTSAPCKAMIAYFAEREVDALLARLPFLRFNERTITEPEAFRTELAKVRRAGYAVDRGEQLQGVHCIGAPIFDRNGSPVAAIWTTGPADRLPTRDFQRLGGIVRQYADRISSRLGYGVLTS